MHLVRVIKCGGRKVNHTCCEGTTHICMRDNVSTISVFVLLMYNLMKCFSRFCTLLIKWKWYNCNFAFSSQFNF